MADIRIDVKGDSSEAQNALKDMGRTVGMSAAQWQEMAAAVKKAGEQVVKFAVDSVKAYAESERVQRQLVRVSGEYADALSEQAEALSRINAVDDDVIKQSQVLLTQWGGVGAATSKVTQAVLDYSAATGVDAVSATKELIRNVESGGVGLAKLGVHFKATGDKGKDLEAAVTALGKKFGGAGASDAQSLAGQIKLAELAFEDVQKSFGSLVGSIESKFGVLQKVAGALRGIAQAVGRIDSVGSLFETTSFGGLATAATAGVLQSQYPTGPSDAGLPAISTVKGATNKATQAAAHGASQEELNDESLERTKKFYDELDSLEEHALQQERDRYAEELKLSADTVENAIKEANERVKVREEMMRNIEKSTAEHNEKLAKLEADAAKKAESEQAKRIESKQREWKQAADAIGGAFVNGLTAQLQKLAAGEEFDVALFVGDILASVVSVAAAAIGTAYGMPALGAAIGNLAGMGIRAGAGAMSNRRLKPGSSAYMPEKFHDGGWVGAPRYHSGSWIGSDEERAILQTGERVLSRQEVRRMGGPSGVDQVAKGAGPAVVVHVSALNAKSVAESVESDFGLGLRRALRSGRGNVGLIPAMAGAQ